LHQLRQDRKAAHAPAARALAIATEKGFPVLSGWARILCGWALAEAGPGERAVAEIRQGLAGLHAQGSDLGRTCFLAMLADACARAGQLDEALKALAEAQEFAEATGERLWEPELHRLTAELLLQRDPTVVQHAEACLQQALSAARRQEALSLELRAAMSLARLWHRHEKTREAEQLLAPVVGQFTEGFQTPELQSARAFLDQCHSAGFARR
jgi:predicted ATPase